LKIGLYGGTFDPVHIAHLILAERVRETLQLQELLFIPCATPPHKGGRRITPAHHRLEMLRLAIAGNDYFKVSDIEIQRGGISYTVDTLEALTKQLRLNKENLFLIIGADNLKEIHTWKNPERIFQLATVVAVQRPAYSDNARVSEFDVIRVKAPLLEISSSDIRMAVREGKSIKYLVPIEVENYIYQNKLYKV